MKEFIINRPAFSLLLTLMLLMSLILFFTMGADKRRARLGKFRISEARLFALALLLGAPGGTAGMYVFHHKTRHLKFKILFPLIALIQLSGLIYLLIH